MMHIRRARALAVALVLAATALATGATPARADSGLLPVLDTCTITVSWSAGAPFHGGGNCVRDLTPEYVRVLGFAPNNTCDDIAFSSDWHGATVQHWHTDGNLLGNSLSTLLPGGGPSIRVGSIYGLFNDADNPFVGGAVFLGTERCTGPNQFFSGTLVIGP